MNTGPIRSTIDLRSAAAAWHPAILPYDRRLIALASRLVLRTSDDPVASLLMNLQHRQLEPELMDQPQTDRAAHKAALDGLRRVNRLCSSTGLLWKALRQLAEGRTVPLRVLDLGSGGGDVIIRLARHASWAGVPMTFHGCDMSDSAVSIAMEAAERARADAFFFRQDVLADGIPAGYDIVMCSLFMHHFDNNTARTLLTKMRQAAGVAVFVDDLLRTQLGYTLCWIGCRILTRSPMVHYDGPQSVKAAFTMDEARKLFEDAGYAGATFRRHWPERFLMQWNRP
jgi:2-polyprenyl-3-methyl-5-hydroxy-6-metoxy-1,4-benzoquinol methylase